MGITDAIGQGIADKCNPLSVIGSSSTVTVWKDCPQTHNYICECNVCNQQVLCRTLQGWNPDLGNLGRVRHAALRLVGAF